MIFAFLSLIRLCKNSRFACERISLETSIDGGKLLQEKKTTPKFVNNVYDVRLNVSNVSALYPQQDLVTYGLHVLHVIFMIGMHWLPTLNLLLH